MRVLMALALASAVLIGGCAIQPMRPLTMGMTEAEVRSLRGGPWEINTLQVGDIRQEQWVYYDVGYYGLEPVAYLYFEDGVLVATQYY